MYARGRIRPACDMADDLELQLAAGSGTVGESILRCGSAVDGWQPPEHAVPLLRMIEPRALRWAAHQLQATSLDPKTAAAAGYLTPCSKKVWYWLRPPLLLVACAFVQSLLLHSATALYVTDMTIYNTQLIAQQPGSSEVGRAARLRRGMLYDVLGEVVGERQAVSLDMLDLSGLLPMLLFLFGMLGLGRRPFAIGIWCARNLKFTGLTQNLSQL